jgi:heme/copper-type cytochrome/quinol oxidase subunit 2
MAVDNSPNAAKTTAPQFQPVSPELPASPVVRHLRLIKAMSIIMAVLIVAALVVIVTTIYSRLTTAKKLLAVTEAELVLPAKSRVTSATATEKGGLVLVIDGIAGQQIWQVTPGGTVSRKTIVSTGE